MSAADALPADDQRLAVIVDPALPPGLLANVVAVISIGLGAVRPAMGGTALTDASGACVFNSADRPVPVLQAGGEAIQALLSRALPAPEGAAVVPFPAYARAIHDFATYRGGFSERRLDAEAIDGIGLVGPAKWVRSLTGSLKLLR
jgi:hypothetical protein